MIITVQCPSCETSFPVDTDKVPEGGVNARCSVCSGIFPVDRPPPEEAGEPPVYEPELGGEVEAASGSLDETWSEAATPAGGAEETRAESGTGIAADTGIADDEDQPEGAVARESEDEPEEAVARESEDAPGAAAVSWEMLDADAERADADAERADADAELADAPAPEAAPSDEGTVEADPEPTDDAALEIRPLEVPAAEPDTVIEGPPPEPEPVEEAPAAEPEPPDPGAGAVPESVPAPAEPPTGFQFGKRDPHEKARRLARVLVSDMIMYNPERHGRALDRGTLKEDFDEEIQKSWDEYVEQVGQDVATGTSYFSEALNEILARGKGVFEGNPPR